MTTPEAVNKVLTPISVVILMCCLLSIGTTILPKRIAAIADRRTKDFVAFCLALGATILLQPFVGFGLLCIFQGKLSEAAVLGIMIMSCTPGGAYSNVLSRVAGANNALNASLTIAEALTAIMLLPFGLFVLLPRVVTGSSQVHGLPVKQVAASLLSVLLPLGLGICAAPTCERITRIRKVLGLVNTILVVLVITFIVVTLVLTGAPPVSSTAILVVSLNQVIGITLAIFLGVCSRQPLPNVISLVFELNVRDLAMANSVIMVGYSSLPFSFRVEACGTCALYGLMWNQGFMLTSLIVRSVIVARRRRFDASLSLIEDQDVNATAASVAEIAEPAEDDPGPSRLPAGVMNEHM